MEGIRALLITSEKGLLKIMRSLVLKRRSLSFLFSAHGYVHYPFRNTKLIVDTCLDLDTPA